MSGSGLIVLLPLVGVIIGAIANGLYRDWQDRKARKREREGLLRIIDSEIYENNVVLKLMIESPDLAEQYPSRSALFTDGWEQSRPRLTQMLDADHTRSLVRHYASVRRIRVLLTDPEPPTKRKKVDVRLKVADVKKKRLVLLSALANSAYLDGEAIRVKGKKYIGELPDYYPKSEQDSEDGQAQDEQPLDDNQAEGDGQDDTPEGR